MLSRAKSLLVVDVSAAQPSSLDWGAVKAAGAVAAIVKTSEGETYVDPLWRVHTKGAARAGLMVGSYHVFRPEHEDPKRQAKAYYKAGWADTMLCPVLDLELDAGGSVSPPVVAARAAVFAEETARLWKKSSGLVYASPAFVKKLAGDAVGRSALERMARLWPLWIAHYGVAEPDVPWPWGSWALWQFAGGDALRIGDKGVRVDTSWFEGSEIDLAKLGEAKDEGESS